MKAVAGKAVSPHVSRAHFLRWLRRVHGWIGLWGAVLGLLFGVTGFLLNHRAVMKIPALQMEQSHFELELPNPAPGNAKEFARLMQHEFALQADRLGRPQAGAAGAVEGRVPSTALLAHDRILGRQPVRQRQAPGRECVGLPHALAQGRGTQRGLDPAGGLARRRDDFPVHYRRAAVDQDAGFTPRAGGTGRNLDGAGRAVHPAVVISACSAASPGCGTSGARLVRASFFVSANFSALTNFYLVHA
jgi:hypothetical protein